MRLVLGKSVLVAVILGILAGFTLGHYTSIFRPIATTFTFLLQMVVLPYLCASLMHGLGSMLPHTAKRLLKNSWPFFLLLWGIMFFLVFLLSYLMPDPNGVLLAPTPMQKKAMVENILTTIVPQNPFYDLANNFLPAVVIFSLIVGIALMYLPQKEPFCGFLERTVHVFEKIFKWLADISPIGVFAHIAIGVGNAQFENVYKIEFYIISFILVCLFVTFWILPLILSSLTRMSYKEVLRAYRYVCLLPFLTGLPTLAIPFLYAYLRRHQIPERTTEAVLPIAFAFGEIGNCLLLYFIFFLSYYFRHPFTYTEEWALTFLTIPLSLGTAATTYSAVPFLVNLFHFPDQVTELYMQMAAITLNFQTLVSVASILTLILLIHAGFTGQLHVKWKQMVWRIGQSLGIFVILVLVLKPVLRFHDHYEDLYSKLKITDAIPNPVASEILKTGEEGVARDPNELPLRQILATGVLKVGFSPEAVPYSYFNAEGQLVGYDIAYAYQLARDLDCKIEFIPVQYDAISEELNEGEYDIGMSAFLMSEDRLAQMNFSRPYDTQDNVLIVPVSKKVEFMHLDHVLKNPKLVILGGGAFFDIAKRHFPVAKVLSSPSMNSLVAGQADAVLWNRTSAFVWCLSHPEFIAIDYGGALGKSYLAYLVRSDSIPLQTFLNDWLLLKEQSGFQKEMYEYWIEGAPKNRPE